MRTPHRRQAALAFCLLGLLLTAPVAAGHAVPLQATPAGGAVVRLPPREVVITFNEPLDPEFSRIQVLDANGTAVNEPSRIDADGVTMRTLLPSALPYGTYTISWRALSEVDGHSTRGILSFLFPDPSKPLEAGALPSAETTQEVLVGPEEWLLRAVGFAGLFAALGGAVLVLGVVGREAPTPWGAERRLGRFVLSVAVAGALATIFLSAVQAAKAADTTALAALSDPGLVFTGRFGEYAAMRAPLLLAAGACAYGASRLGGGTRHGFTLWTACAGLALAGFATVSLTSHAGALPQWSTPAVLMDLVHQAASAAWIGGLAGLAWVLLRPAANGTENPPRWARVAQRFSSLATAAVGVVVLTGVAASVLQVKTLGGLWGSDYGKALLVKVTLVAGVLALGAYNRFRVLPTLQSELAEEFPKALGRFTRSTRLEALLGASVLLAAGALSAISPPLAAQPEAEQAPAVLELSQVKEGVNITLLMTPFPLRAGSATVDAFLADAASGVSLNGTKNATFTFRPPDRTLGDQRVEAPQVHPAHFAAEGPFFTVPGNWTVRVLVQREGAFDLLADFTVTVEG